MSRVISFEKPTITKFNHLIQIDTNDDDRVPYVFLSRNDDAEGQTSYYLNAFINDWSLIQRVSGTMQQIEKDVRDGKIVLQTSGSRMFGI